MPDGATLTAIGETITVDLSMLEQDGRDRFLTAWEWCGAQVSSAPADSIAPSSGSYEEVVHRLSSQITLKAIGLRKHDLLMFHAGAVADPATGSVVAFVAPSGTGKTTAAIALGRRFAYVTDETVGVTDDLEVVPYRKPLSVVQAESHLKNQASPRSLGLVDLGEAPLRLVAIIMLDRQPDAADPIVTRLSALDSIPELVPQLSYLPDRAGALHRVRDVVNACGGVLRVTYTEAETLVPLVSELLEREPRPIQHHDYVRPTATPPALGQFGLGQLDDVIDEDGALIVLSDRTARVIGGIGPTLWNRMPATFEQLRDAAVADFGTPATGTADALVTAALNYFLEAGLVIRG